MTIKLTPDEASLVRYACRELAFKRITQATGAHEFSDPNAAEAHTYMRIAEQISAEMHAEQVGD